MRSMICGSKCFEDGGGRRSRAIAQAARIYKPFGGRIIGDDITRNVGPIGQNVPFGKTSFAKQIACKTGDPRADGRQAEAIGRELVVGRFGHAAILL